ncbi:MAG TPA: methionyl-tRNA formyltransferase [Terriglobales bacterium]|nr:methionyl-tRNA formyltransferase [Terriglobales bacterium]
MTRSLNLVFCGTPLFAVPTLQKLADAGFNISLVVTQPDKPRGRGLELAPSPVKQRATELHLPITQPTTIKNNEDFKSQLAAITPDAIIVVGYGRIIPQWMIDLPPLGNINGHASLLPKYRGAAPIQWAIANGETVTGVTTMRIDAGLDTGDILLQRELPIGDEDTAVSLAPRLADIGADVMVQTLRGLQDGRIQPRPQDHANATLAPILKREDGLIDFHRPATEIYNRLRGFQPWPGAYTLFRGKNFQIHWAKPTLAQPNLPPGELCIQNDKLFVACGSNTALDLIEVQLEGKKPTSGADFARGYRIAPGERLG